MLLFGALQLIFQVINGLFQLGYRSFSKLSTGLCLLEFISKNLYFFFILVFFLRVLLRLSLKRLEVVGDILQLLLQLRTLTVNILNTAGEERGKKKK